MKFARFKILFWITILNAFLWAQNYSLSLTNNFNPNRKVNWNLLVEINGVQNSVSGLVLSFPENTDFVPVQIKTGERSFWLKEANNYPDSDKVVHWEKVDSLMILRFARNISVPDGRVSVYLNFTNREKGSKKEMLKLMTLLPQGGPGATLSQIEIRSQQSVTR